MLRIYIRSGSEREPFETPWPPQFMRRVRKPRDETAKPFSLSLTQAEFRGRGFATFVTGFDCALEKYIYNCDRPTAANSFSRALIVQIHFHPNVLFLARKCALNLQRLRRQFSFVNS